MAMPLGACGSVGSGRGRWKWAVAVMMEELALPTESEAGFFRGRLVVASLTKLSCFWDG